jgi:hypothetical protein
MAWFPGFIFHPQVFKRMQTSFWMGLQDAGKLVFFKFPECGNAEAKPRFNLKILGFEDLQMHACLFLSILKCRCSVLNKNAGRFSIYFWMKKGLHASGIKNWVAGFCFKRGLLIRLWRTDLKNILVSFLFEEEFLICLWSGLKILIWFWEIVIGLFSAEIFS